MTEHGYCNKAREDDEVAFRTPIEWKTDAPKPLTFDDLEVGEWFAIHLVVGKGSTLMQKTSHSTAYTPERASTIGVNRLSNVTRVSVKIIATKEGT
jgi:hypothetical protein